MKEEKSNNKLILVVDNSSLNKALFKVQLKHLGYPCMFATNGAEAIYLYSENFIDLIFMDFKMPVLNGFDTVKIIRKIEENEKKSKVPIIGLSANYDDSMRKKIRDVGFTQCYSKPISKDFIKVLLKTYL